MQLDVPQKARSTPSFCSVTSLEAPATLVTLLLL